jgi:3D (Asp-Asp-Asp) domain-containing protein/cell division protein FtsB
MSGFEAADSIRPRSSVKHYRLARKKTGSYIWAVLILFVLVGFLCINNYSVLQSYKEVRDELEDAYKRMDSAKIVNADLESEMQDVRKQKDMLTEENKSLREAFDKASRGSADVTKQLEGIKKQYSELAKQNKELVNENVALQNSLKMAAAVGVKPQNYSIFDGLDQRESINRGKYVGKFTGTAYTPSKEECGNDMGLTKSGEPIVPGVSVAVDTKYWPFGTVFYIKGLGYTVAMDTGSAIKGKYRFDFSVLDKKFAQELGTRKWDVYLVKLGDGNVGDIEL